MLEIRLPLRRILQNTLVSKKNAAEECVAESELAVVPWEEVRGPAAVQKKPDSPPPTFATATATNLTDRHEVVNDSSQGLLAVSLSRFRLMGP